MDIRRLASPEEAAAEAADFVANRMRLAVAERGLFTLALSGGSTPWKMMHRLAELDLPWEFAHVFQVDERVAADGDPDRNLTHIREQLTDRIGLSEDHLHAMPVNHEDLHAGAFQYSELIRQIAGAPAILDLVHLGIGSDGHTASLIPGDRLLQETKFDVGVSLPYQGRPRMSLTFPILNRARNVLWLITGADKACILERLIRNDPEIPAACVSTDRATIVTDSPAVTGSE